MPGLFTPRRRGSSANPPLDRSTSLNAAAAASSAFVRNAPSNSSLSSAAAAAALRSLTTTPEPVGNIRTKRMVRRGSVSSIGSGSVVGTGGTGTRPGLQRTNSSGSMTERTFRSPSPGRPGSRNSQIQDAPPVPAVPKSIPGNRQRAASLQPAPQRIMSPNRGGRGASVDRAPSIRGGPALAILPEEQQNRNVNFSRPMSPSPTSPVAQTHGSGGWFAKPNGVSAKQKPAAISDAANAKLARIQAAATGQSAKRSSSASSAHGQHLAQARQDAGLAAPVQASNPATYETTNKVMVFDPHTRTFVEKPGAAPKAPKPAPPALPPAEPLAPGTYDPHTRTLVPLPQSAQPQALTSNDLITQNKNVSAQPDSDAMRPPPRNPARTSPMSSHKLHKQPSMVREEQEEEEQAASEAGTTPLRTNTAANTPSKTFAAPRQAPHQRSASLDVPKIIPVGAGRGRTVSTSPGSPRSTRFSSNPIVQGTVHNPLPRDVSPAKSAMKHSHSPSSSIRTASPLANFSPGGYRSTPSEASDTTSITSQDGVTPGGRRKKSVRVSFDEHAVEIDAAHAAAAPVALSRDRPALDDPLEEDDLMKPRPALPSFGSVRKSRPASGSAEKATVEPTSDRTGVSSDIALGGILMNANGQAKSSTSKPIATATTGNEVPVGHVAEANEIGSVTPVVDSTQADASHAALESEKVGVASEAVTDKSTDVPNIELYPPTPNPEEEDKILAAESLDHEKRVSFTDGISVPGGWNKEDDASQAKLVSGSAAAATVAAVKAQARPNSGLAVQRAGEDSDEGEDFSDAAEDLTDVETGGFASLNAIANSPIAHASTTPVSPPESPTARHTRNAGSEGNGDWNEVTAYWSKLSKQQREQIEREHMPSSDDERPPPVMKQPKKTRVSDVAPLPSDIVQTRAPPAKKRDPPPPDAQPAQPAMKKTLRNQSAPEVASDGASKDGEVHMRRTLRAGDGGMAASTLRGGARPRPKSAVETNSAAPRKNQRPVSESHLSNTTLPASAVAAAMLQRQREEAAVSQSSAYPMIKTNSSSSVKRASSYQAATVVSPQLQKELAHDSDSESSFKKKRRPSTSTVDASGRYNMRRSMRASSVESSSRMSDVRPTSPTPARRGKDSFSIRSLSPNVFNRNKGEKLRSSLRASSVEPPPARMSLRNQPPAPKSLRATSAQPSAKPSRFKSRFNDSDDEDDDMHPTRGIFRSRFNDSDDEDEGYVSRRTADLAPVRGIPRRRGQEDGESTDLDDESEAPASPIRREKFKTPLVPAPGDVDKAMDAARKKLGIPAETTSAKEASKEGDLLSKGSLRSKPAAVKTQDEARPDSQDSNASPQPQKKRGFMSSLLRRNNRSTSASTIPTLSMSGARTDDTPLPQSPAARPSTAIVPQSPSARPSTATGKSSFAKFRPTTPTRSPTSDLPSGPVSPIAPSLPPLPDPVGPISLGTSPAPTPPVRSAAASPTRTPSSKLVRRVSAQNTPIPPTQRLQRADSTFSNATAPPAVGDPAYHPADWPLPPPVPRLPDGVNGGSPTAGSGVRFEGSVDGDGVGKGGERKDGVVYSARTGKKKKFGLLRRAFGLND